MPERDNKGNRPVQEITQEYRNHLLSVEFNSPDYLAFCDFYELQNLEFTRQININNTLTSKSPEEEFIHNSALRITEGRVATLATMIDDRKIRDIEYKNAYDRVEATMEELRNAISEEVKPDYPNPDDQSLQISREQDTYKDILTEEFRDVLYRFSR